jgi:glycosyltransferase involved in cell wall biosynthesis
MRVVIDAVPLLIRSAGVKNYLYYWIRHLRRAAVPGAIRTFPALNGFGPLNHDASVAGLWRTCTGLAELALANYTPLPVMDLLSREADIFHASALIRRPPRRPRLTATIYDMTCFLMPELHSAANLRADQSFAELLRRAHRLIAISECTKNDAVRVLGIAAEKITVIHPGIGEAFFDPPPPKVAEVRNRYGLRRPFVLCVGTIEPRKNLGTLLDAFQALPASIRDQFELAVAGPVGWASTETMARITMAQPGDSATNNSIRYLGYVPESDIAALTAAATVFAYPSLYEGFGFPVAQAMAAGVPVITSNVSSLPEIAGDAAILIDPRSQAELRDALARLLLSPGLCAELAGRGRLRAQAFRWETCAARSLEFFEEAATRRQ